MANRLRDELTRLDVCIVERKKTWSFITEATAAREAMKKQQDRLKTGGTRASKFMRRFVCFANIRSLKRLHSETSRLGCASSRLPGLKQKANSTTGHGDVLAGQPKLTAEQRQAAVQAACAWYHTVTEIRGAERAGVAAARAYLESLKGTRGLRCAELPVQKPDLPRQMLTV